MVADAAQLAALESDGCLILPGRMDAAVVARALANAADEVARVRAQLGNRQIGIGSAAGFHEIVQRSPDRWDVPVPLDALGLPTLPAGAAEAFVYTASIGGGPEAIGVATTLGLDALGESPCAGQAFCR